jgi:membrane protease YdiL (CAAX protease family)
VVSSPQQATARIQFATMTATPIENRASDVVAFRDARWSARWIVLGLLVLLLWRSVGFMPRVWLFQFPWLLVLIATTFLPEIFLLIYPIATRDPNRSSSFAVPGPLRWLVEFGIAVPTVIGTIVLLSVANYLIQRFSPAISLTPEEVTGLARMPDRAIVYVVLIFSFTLGPVAEELFFRGFLHNAFRARMPLLVAAILQSVVFGLIHFYSPMHIGVVTLFGLLLTAVYEWRKNLLAPILVHAGLNFISAIGVLLMMTAHDNRPVVGVMFEPGENQCVILEIVPGSAAEEAGLQAGDTIVSFNEQSIRDARHFQETVWLYRAGDRIPVKIKRGDKTVEVVVVLRKRAE